MSDDRDAARDVFERFERDRRLVSSQIRSPWVATRFEFAVTVIAVLLIVIFMLIGGSL